jgi:hypothetical protein
MIMANTIQHLEPLTNSPPPNVQSLQLFTSMQEDPQCGMCCKPQQLDGELVAPLVGVAEGRTYSISPYNDIDIIIVSNIASIEYWLVEEDKEVDMLQSSGILFDHNSKGIKRKRYENNIVQSMQPSLLISCSMEFINDSKEEESEQQQCNDLYSNPLDALPLDIQYTVLGNLHFYDILSLSSTCKSVNKYKARFYLI